MAVVGSERSDGATGPAGDERLRSLADNIPGGIIFQVAAEGERRRLTYVSRGVEALFGVTPEAALADASTLYDRLVPEANPDLADRAAEALRTGLPFKAEIVIRGPRDARSWLQVTAAPHLRTETVEIWDGIALDVTDRRVAEEAREQSERRLEIATNSAGIGIWEWNTRTNEVVYSRRAKEICGFPLDQPLLFAQLTAATHPEDLPHTSAAARRAIDPAIRSREIYRYRIIRADTGEIRWVVAHGEATFGVVEGREVALSYIGTLLDITDQQRSEEALVESEARLRLAVEAGQMAVWELDLASGTITPSPQLNKLCGFPPDATPSLADLQARYAPGERERIELEAAEITARGETQIQTEFRQLWPDGSEHWLLLRAAAVPPRTGTGPRAIGVLVDITERRRAEERTALVARELQHRVKNTLAIVQTIAGQSFRPGRDSKAALEAFSGRLAALAAATQNITSRNWSDAALAEVVDAVLSPFRSGEADYFSLEGTDLPIPGRVALGVGMALHELCTNALKYGALSVPGGRVRVFWETQQGQLVLAWREEGGPAVTPPAQRGFGTRMLERGLFGGSGDEVALEFLPAGLSCTIRARLTA